MQESPIAEIELIKTLRQRRRAEGHIFWAQHNVLAVLDAQAAQRLDAANFADLTLPDSLADVVRGRKSEAVTWQQVRSAWAGQMRHLSGPLGVEQLARRMDDMLDAQVGRHQDLGLMIARLSAESLVPAIITGLSAGAHRRVVNDLRAKMAWVLSNANVGRWHKLKMLACQLGTGLAVRRALQSRANGRRPRQLDLTDPLVDLLAGLGLDRAVDAVATLLTAISGSPPSAAACLVFELSRQHQWRARLESELCAVPPADIYSSPMRAAPLTGRFAKEVLRLWGSPSITVRRVRTDIKNDDVSLKTGQLYMLSGFMVHHDTRDWPDAESFDPDRWLSDSPRGACPHASYVPFGWAPNSCVGANLGLAQMITLAQLLCTRYRIEAPDPERAHIALDGIVMPVNFNGTVVRR